MFQERSAFKRNEKMDHKLTAAATALGEGAGAMYYMGSKLDVTPATLPDNPSSSDVVYSHIHDLRMMDANPRLNMATYVTTWMEEKAQQLMLESMNINHVDAEIYRSSNDIEARCVSILAHLFHSPAADKPTGCATVGSTEACLLGGLNMKKRWADARRAKGLPTDKPNLILPYSFQVCWEKFCKYWDVEMKEGHMRPGRHVLEPEDVEKLADENTIGVVAVLGSTYTGDFDNVKEISDVCEKLRKEKGLDLMIHIDGASGAMIAPFLYPNLVWDFQIPNVISISLSGHKYGLVYPGIGWMLWRSAEMLHPDLVFHLSYLGTQQTNLTLNFSRPASHIIGSYYQFLRLGKQGYTMVAHNMQQVACYLAQCLKDMGAFHILNDPSKTLPMVTFSLLPYPPGGPPSNVQQIQQQADGSLQDNAPAGPADTGSIKHANTSNPEMKAGKFGPPRAYTLFELADKMKERGWSIPAYKMPPDCTDLIVCRCVIREDFTLSLAEQLVKDFKHALEWLDIHFAGRTREEVKTMAEHTHAKHRKPSVLHKHPKHHVGC